jgi:hypothetical protein
MMDALSSTPPKFQKQEEKQKICRKNNKLSQIKFFVKIGFVVEIWENTW